ncbi:DUF4190 domain-containing protein [Cellulomonas palmilytica]|uniref:DUF4190 domain-containing protein n=1 Tax=Cellulomonas palmilytica TaxID=2608402 RepID=UPI001F2B5D5F|nr:DUF4190 domain-containing protein [Cellulomonas palmilytica]UJP40842.1 DUF4190 domain-containing protein [Cellulomonas palmilytica]
MSQTPDPFPPEHYAPTWAATQRPVEKFAVAALVVSLLFWLWPTFGLLAVAFGITALRAVRANGTRGRGLAVAGIAVGAVGTLVVLALGVGIAVAFERDRTIPTDVTEPVTTTVDRLGGGHCIRDLPADGPVSEVVVVPCSDPHEAEVRARVTVQGGSAWPGQQVVDELVERACLDDEHYARTGEPLDVVWAPDEAGWKAGDRLGLCVQRAR